MYSHRRTCRSCGSSPLSRLLDLGDQYVVDFIVGPEEINRPKAPLVLGICPRCYLVQLAHTVEADILYKTFWYRSGVSEVMRAALMDVVISSLVYSGKTRGKVLDIGCNDGTMLSMFSRDWVRVGVDPSNQIPSDMLYMRGYFGALEVQNWLKMQGEFDIITAIAMFYDLDNPAQFLMDCRDLLTPDGILVIQMNYLASMLKNCAFDNICHEHLTYFSLSTLLFLTSKCGLDCIGVSTNDVNGGSIRVYLCKTGAKPTGLSSAAQEIHNTVVSETLREEHEMGLAAMNPYNEFSVAVQANMAKLRTFIREQVVEKNEPMFAYGASTRGSTLLQTLAMAPALMGVAERDTNKYGKMTAGSWLRIWPEEAARKAAKYFLVLPYHFLSGILTREVEFGRAGGQLLVPLPVPCVYSHNGMEWEKRTI